MVLSFNPKAFDLTLRSQRGGGRAGEKPTGVAILSLQKAIATIFGLNMAQAAGRLAFGWRNVREGLR